MLTEVMRHYGLARPPVDAGFFETEHHREAIPRRDAQRSWAKPRCRATSGPRSPAGA